MSNVTKLKLILELCKEHNITAYEIGKNTIISTFAAQNLLDGKTKKPHINTLNEILEFLEKAIVGTNIKTAEPPVSYEKPESIEDIVADKVVQKLLPYFKKLEQALAENMLDVDDIKDSLEKILKKQS